MSKKLRYEFYLPSYYNNKIPVESKKYKQVKSKIIKQFGAISIHTAIVQGVQINPQSKEICYDKCHHLEITVDKTNKNMAFFKRFKKELKKLFKQYDIYMVYSEINSV